MSGAGTPSSEAEELRLAGLAEGIIDRGFMYEPERQEDLYLAVEQVSEYVRENHIENLVLIDRGARPIHVGVREYFKQKGDDDACPNIYFINPDGCDSNVESTQSGLLIVTSDLSEISDIENLSRSAADRPTFEDEHSQLFTRRDRPTLILDGCTHTGKTLDRVVRTFEEEGFTDIDVGVVQDRDEMDAFMAGDREIEPDFIVDSGEKLTACYPFGPEFHLIRQGDSYLVRRAKDRPDVFRALSVMARKEIRDIVRQFS